MAASASQAVAPRGAAENAASALARWEDQTRFRVLVAADPDDRFAIYLGAKDGLARRHSYGLRADIEACAVHPISQVRKWFPEAVKREGIHAH